jgi:nitrite reductase/ring-hydroxylating ferredoxin subunit
VSNDREEPSVSESEWVAAVNTTELPDGGYVAVYPRGLGVLVARVGDEYYAVANKCFHMGCPLEGGRLNGTVITCPCHDWRFDLRDGHFITTPALRIATFPTRVEGETIHIDLKGA